MLDTVVKKMTECKHKLYCDACGDCIRCYGEDRCYKMKDGKHVTVELHKLDAKKVSCLKSALRR